MPAYLVSYTARSGHGSHVVTLPQEPLTEQEQNDLRSRITDECSVSGVTVLGWDVLSDHNTHPSEMGGYYCYMLFYRFENRLTSGSVTHISDVPLTTLQHIREAEKAIRDARGSQEIHLTGCRALRSVSLATLMLHVLCKSIKDVRVA